MKIVSVEAVVLSTPAPDRRAADQTHEAALVRITSEDGLVGIGEAAVLPPVVKAFIDEPTSFSWSRGVGDIVRRRGRARPAGGCGTRSATAPSGRPAWASGASRSPASTWRSGISRARRSASRSGSCSARERPEPVVPYLTMYSGPSPLATTIRNTNELVDRAREGGFRAAKIEALTDTTADNDEIVELVRAVRAHAGPGVHAVARRRLPLARRRDEALDCIRRLEEFDLFFIETPFMPELVDDYRRLAEESPIADRRRRDPHVVRGVRAAARRGHRHRAGGHLPRRHHGVRSARAPGCASSGGASSPTATSRRCSRSPRTSRSRQPTRTFRWSSTRRRRTTRTCSCADELAGPEPRIRDGAFELPTAPGLGIELDEDAVARYRVS